MLLCPKPDEIVRYRPGFWEMIKYGWVQYIAIFFVVRYLLWNLEVRHTLSTRFADTQDSCL